ncbi:32884_t:CDS:2, partial [Racocetra persica]
QSQAFWKKNFRRLHDQNKYNSIRDVGILLHDAIQENSVEKVQEDNGRRKLEDSSKDFKTNL